MLSFWSLFAPIAIRSLPIPNSYTVSDFERLLTRISRLPAGLEDCLVVGISNFIIVQAYRDTATNMYC
jgi:hypothetical protein